MKISLPRRRVAFIALLALVALLPAKKVQAIPHQPCCGEITAAGQQLAAILDAMNVQALWIADQHVN